MPTTTIPISEKCTQLVVTGGVPITSLDGRLRGNEISFTKFNYNDYAMRRKAEVLKYNNLGDSTQKSTYSYLSTNGYYSKAQLKKILDGKTVDCNASSSSSCSGVFGSYSTYYLNASVPFYSSI